MVKWPCDTPIDISITSICRKSSTSSLPLIWAGFSQKPWISPNAASISWKTRGISVEKKILNENWMKETVNEVQQLLLSCNNVEINIIAFGIALMTLTWIIRIHTIREGNIIRYVERHHFTHIMPKLFEIFSKWIAKENWIVKSCWRYHVRASER